YHHAGGFAAAARIRVAVAGRRALSAAARGSARRAVGRDSRGSWWRTPFHSMGRRGARAVGGAVPPAVSSRVSRFLPRAESFDGTRARFHRGRHAGPERFHRGRYPRQAAVAGFQSAGATHYGLSPVASARRLWPADHAAGDRRGG